MRPQKSAGAVYRPGSPANVEEKDLELLEWSQTGFMGCWWGIRGEGEAALDSILVHFSSFSVSIL